MTALIVPSRRYWTRLANLATLWALVLVVVIAVIATWVKYGEDFVTFYAPAKVVLAGQNPYDYNQIVATILNATGQGGNSPFYYPLWVVFPIFPLAFFPFQISRWFWLIAQVIFWATGLRLTEKMFGKYPVSWIGWLVWLGTFLIFGWSTLRAEQIAFALFFDWVFCLWAIERGHSKIAAIALALLLIKPNVTFLPFIALSLYAWQKERKIVLGMVATLALLFSISTLVTPGWWSPIVEGHLPNGWNQGLSGHEVDARRLTTTTLDFLDYNLGIRQAPAMLVQVGIDLLAVYLVWGWRRYILYDSVLAIAFGLMVTPYAMQYDYAFLTPALLWVVHHVPQLDWSKKIIVVAGLVFLMGILFWEKPVSDGLLFPVTLIFLLFLTPPPTRRRPVLTQGVATG